MKNERETAMKSQNSEKSDGCQPQILRYLYARCAFLDVFNSPKKRFCMWRIFIGWLGVLLDFSLVANLHKMCIKSARIWSRTFAIDLTVMAQNHQKLLNSLLDSKEFWGAKSRFHNQARYPDRAIKIPHMTNFYRAVRNLVDFSLVTKLTKHVSKVRETVRKCEKTRRNDCETFFMTSDSQKMISRFLDSSFCTKFQISQPVLYPDLR